MVSTLQVASTRVEELPIPTVDHLVVGVLDPHLLVTIVLRAHLDHQLPILTIVLQVVEVLGRHLPATIVLPALNMEHHQVEVDRLDPPQLQILTVDHLAPLDPHLVTGVLLVDHQLLILTAVLQVVVVLGRHLLATIALPAPLDHQLPILTVHLLVVEVLDHHLVTGVLLVVDHLLLIPTVDLQVVDPRLLVTTVLLVVDQEWVNIYETLYFRKF